MRRKLLGLGVAAAALALMVPCSALAFDSAEEVLCTCAEDVLGTGDYVSCVSHMTRRLVATGVIDKAARSDLVRNASHTDLEALSDLCASMGGGGEFEGWGVSLQVKTPFYVAPSPTGPVAGAIATFRLWNRTGYDVLQSTPVLPTGEGCTFLVRVLDDQNRLVREVPMGCFEAIGELNMDDGDVLVEADIIVPLIAENADPATGLINGQSLPTGVYRLEMTWNAHGPQKATSGPALQGGFPMAVITLRVG